MLVLGGIVVSGTTPSAFADDIRANCCAEIKEQVRESSDKAPDLYIPLPLASYLGSKTDDGPLSGEGFFNSWASIARQAKASQPHWITPLATVTPRLEQEFRYDQFFEHLATGADIKVYDGGKGLELIPTTTNEVLINLPPYDQRTIVRSAKGWGDWPALTIKQRLLSANEENGNYIVTTFLGVQAPTGQVPFTNDAWVVTPTLAAGKGWGDFDIQATIGVPIPLEHEDSIGVSIVTNVAFQYHIAKYFWPEIDVNYTHWTDGDRSGKDQVFFTPGLILGRFELAQDTNLIVGGGYQFAVTPVTTKPVLTPVYDNNWIATTRLTF
jgi:Putative MetA-pathway of phenol degradation